MNINNRNKVVKSKANLTIRSGSVPPLSKPSVTLFLVDAANNFIGPRNDIWNIRQFNKIVLNNEDSVLVRVSMDV